MFPRVVQGIGWITRRCQRLHQPQRESRVVGIIDRHSPPPLHRPRQVASRVRRSGQRLQRSFVLTRQPLALRVGPMLEFRTSFQVQSFYELAAVDLHGRFFVASRQRRLKLRHVGLDDLRIQA